MKKFLFPLFLLCFAANFGCNFRRDTGVVYLEESVKTDAKPVALDTIQIAGEFLYAKRMYVYRDRYLVIENNPNAKAVPFIEIYDFQNQRKVKGMIHNGNGPGEMVMIETHLAGNILMVRDFAKRQYAAIDLDAALSDDNYRPAVQKINTDMGMPNMAWLDKNRMVVLNPNCFEDKNLGIHNEGEERFLIVSPSVLSEKVEFQFYPHITTNVTQAQIMANSSKNRIVYASLNFSIIEVYDGTLKKIRTVNGPDDLPRSFAVGQAGDLSFKGGVPFSYTGFCCDDDHFWLSYVGKYYESGSANMLYKTPSYIFRVCLKFSALK